MIYSLLSVLPLLALVAGQNASTVDIQGVEANFQAAQLVPQLVSTFTPQGVLDVSFGGSAITIGQNLTQETVGTFPALTLAPAANATDFMAGNQYTLIMVDADIVGTDEATMAQTRHWLVNGASVEMTGEAPYAFNYTGATSVTDYAGPGPAAGSGPHRYTILVYLQPSTFTPPANLSAAGTPLGTMYLSSYVSESGLQGPLAANYFQVENGVATVTVAQTTAVDSATLAAMASTTSSMASGTSSVSAASTSASGSGSAAASGPAASGSAAPSASASSTGGAGQRSEITWGAVIGGMGVVGTILGAVAGL